MNISISINSKVAGTLAALVTLTALLVLPQPLHSQPLSVYCHKLSPSLQTLVGYGVGRRSAARAVTAARVCALVRTSDASGVALTDNDCTPLVQLGDIFVADIPVGQLPRLAADCRVSRIEAERSNSLQLDSMALYTHAADIYTGLRLPQAYTGSGVVLGIMDVGFDLTHPTFLAADGATPRIRRFWDQLSADTVGGSMYVGAEYATDEAIRAYAHSRDGEVMYHGTHTLGIAAGSGAGSAYVGMAPESDLCLVSNAVSGDEPFIGDDDLYKYTTATDILGFKYIFDYAESVGKPCVISFSEGSRQDFRGDCQLYADAISRLVGPGRVIVASAGNECTGLRHFAKPAGRQSAGTFVSAADGSAMFTVRADRHVCLRTTLYSGGAAVSAAVSPRVSVDGGRVTVSVSSADVCAAPDSTLADTVVIGGVEHVHTVQAYRSCYNAADIVLDVTHTSSGQQDGVAVSAEIVGGDASADAYLVRGSFGGSALNPLLADADMSQCILSPGSAPDVICVGSTNYRQRFGNYWGGAIDASWGETGKRSGFSSVGPTFDGRTKPDVMAPGSNIVSAMSSYYLKAQDADLNWLVGTFDRDGRTYGWSASCGTSMSTPAVAGIVALWLQACPSLSPADIMGVISRTSRECGYYGEQTPNYCGYGAIDAYAGLLDILGLSGVEGIGSAMPQGVCVSVSGGVLGITFDRVTAGTVGVQVYGMDGRLLLARQLEGGQREYAVGTGLPKGVYAVQVNAGEGAQSGSMLVRIG